MTNFAEVPLDGLNLITDRNRIIIRWRDDALASWITLVIGVMVSSFFLFICFQTNLFDSEYLADVQVDFLLVAITLPLLGAIISFFNFTDFILTPEHIRISNLFLRIVWSQKICASELMGFGLHSFIRAETGAPARSHMLFAITQKDRKKKLLYFTSREQAEYVCKYLSDYYHLPIKNLIGQ